MAKRVMAIWREFEAQYGQPAGFGAYRVIRGNDLWLWPEYLRARL